MRNTHTPVSQPFVLDNSSLTRSSGRQVLWNLVPNSYRETAVNVTVGTGGATANGSTAVAVPVTALPVDLLYGQSLYFGGQKFGNVAAFAAKGATTVSLVLSANIVAGDVATVGGAGTKRILPGTVMVEVVSGNYRGVVPRAVRPAAETAYGIIETYAIEGDPSAAKSGYGVIIGGVLFENLLPDATGSPKVLPTAYKTELQAAGTGFSFEQYYDSTAG